VAIPDGVEVLDSIKPAPQADKPLTSKGTPKSVIVPSEEYRQLFHGWRNAGDDKIEGEKPALLVENLRQTFDSFNMKAIVLRGGQAFDLLDGSRLPDGFLESYATTVFQVDNPWQDWDAELKKQGLQRGSQVQVRYYMYDFIHNAIYSRTKQAINWAKRQGLLSVDRRADELEVRGHAYLIKQQGGGRFGVFVPQQILTVSGKPIEVPSAVFAEQQDVAQLQQAGIL
ncbi:MAG: hypothetical protein U9R29_06630, partial [Thermodesulfobacteriota bacterium]|nr:hypothetical protein [Thermodesulfobacteriota bacterium]